MSGVAVVDGGLCNLDSILRALEECGGNPFVANRANDVGTASHIVLPGVGAFHNAMKNLREAGLVEALKREVLENRIPILGICLGMQLLATRGLEVKETQGLDLIPGEIRHLECKSEERLPHVGWNEVDFVSNGPLFDGIPDHKDFYFVHSYHFVCRDKQHCLATTPYCGGFTSVVGHKNIFGTQFHPEKSQAMGFALIRNFLAL